MRAGHENPHPFFTAHGVFGRTARVARCRAQNVELFATPRQLVFKQVAQQLHGHVLEGQGGAVGQGFQIQIWPSLAGFLQGLEWDDLLGTEHLLGVRLAAQGLQVVAGNIVDVKRQNLECQTRIALACPDLAQTSQGSCVELRVAFRQVQTAIWGQAFEQDFTKLFAVCVAACRQVTHQFNSSLRMRTIGAMTVGSACISAKTAFSVPSRVSWVRMITSVWFSPAWLT